MPHGFICKNGFRGVNFQFSLLIYSTVWIPIIPRYVLSDKDHIFYFRILLEPRGYLKYDIQVFRVELNRCWGLLEGG